MDPKDETYKQAKQRLKTAIAEVGHAAVNLGPEWVEEKFNLTNPWRHWIGKGMAWAVIFFLFVAVMFLGAVVFGYFDV